MSIVRRLLLIGVMSMLPMAMGAQAAANTFVRSADQLSENPTIRIYEKPYKLATGAMAIVERCRSELGIIPIQEAFIKKRFQELGAAYLKAFEDAFTERFKAPSSPALKEDYVRFLKDLQKTAVTQIYKVAAGKKGCRDRGLTDVIKYFDQLQKAEASGNPQPLVKPRR